MLQHTESGAKSLEDTSKDLVMKVGLSDAVALLEAINSIANRGAVRLQPSHSQILPINRGAVEFSAKRYENPLHILSSRSKVS